jgi:folate-dependent phosphoribosylglycinamide formyltransferase PurN
MVLMPKKKLIIFATGEKGSESGGSGMKNLIEASRDGRLNAEIVAVVGNISGGGVETKARACGVHFEYFPKALRTPESHEALVERLLDGDDGFVALSGCLWQVPVKADPWSDEPGLDSRRVFNIHPGNLSLKDEQGHPIYGGPGKYGHYVHEKAIADYRRGVRIRASAVSMHFVTKEYDKGPIVFQWDVPIFPSDTPETLARAVNVQEHRFQPYITDLIVNQRIVWDGVDPRSLKVPSGYEFLPV